jgi:hypothetical protein
MQKYHKNTQEQQEQQEQAAAVAPPLQQVKCGCEGCYFFFEICLDCRSIDKKK